MHCLFGRHDPSAFHSSDRFTSFGRFRHAATAFPIKTRVEKWWRDLGFSGFSQSVSQYVCFATSPRTEVSSNYSSDTFFGMFSTELYRPATAIWKSIFNSSRILVASRCFIPPKNSQVRRPYDNCHNQNILLARVAKWRVRRTRGDQGSC